MVEVTRRKRFVFNPDEETKEMLIATFAIRKDLFEKIFKIIKSSSRDTAPQHFLLVGQRGMGKTTLLLRLKYEMEDDRNLNRYLLPVRFSEEQYQIGCLPDLWEETALYLESIDKGFAGLKDNMLTHEKEKDYERISFNLLTQQLKTTGKRVVLLIDNIGDLFNKFTNQENHRFREILMTSPHFLLIGASSQMLEHTFRYDKPFFEFFYQLKLEPLLKEEATDLMKALASNYNAYDKIEKIIKEHPERVEVLRRITGGVPRTLVLLFEILIDSDNGNTFEDLEELTDRVSPLYKERMDALKPQQQKIMDTLARAWEPLTASEILEQSKLYRENLASNQVSAQLKQLEENQLVETIDLGKRKKAYRIRERFFNIWYLMRHGRKNTKEQVLWLIRFLETWCTHDELKEIANKQIACLENDTYSTKAAYYKAIALHNIDGIEEGTKKKLLDNTERFLQKNEKQEWAKIIHALSENINNNSFTKKAVNNFETGYIKKAETFFLTALEKNELDAEYNLGNFYYILLKDIDKAEQFYLRAIEKGNIMALNNIASLYKNERKDFDKSEYFYLKAIEKGYVDALFNIATLYQNERKDFDKAEEFYLKAIEKGNISALNNIAILYSDERKDFDKAEEFYLKAIEKGNVKAMHNYIYLLFTKNKINESLNQATILFNQNEYFQSGQDKAIELVLHLILLGQYHFLLKAFQKENSLLMKYMQPVYYVLAWFMKEELPGEYEKAGSEIKETVDEIIASVEKEKAATSSTTLNKPKN
ncbi:MAG: tetratricopeptide repeat protein [Chitinophagaceae bacterium]|nr:tetratricopeptide repeat protein [Chitinophagaceae bacterium]